jgi:hypothetical protein
VALRASTDPRPERLTFRVHAVIDGLAMSDLYQLLEAKADAHADKGTLSSTLDLSAHEGQIEGTVRTVLRNVDVETEHKDIGDRLKAWIADKSFDLVAHETPRGQTAKATLPIRGTLRNPEAPVVPTMLALVRGSIARGISDALGGKEK